LIVEPEPRALAESLDSLYADRAGAQEMGARGQEKLKAMNLSWQHVVESLISGAG
jgi:hypothetical protein